MFQKKVLDLFKGGGGVLWMPWMTLAVNVLLHS
jgi:hypothetical protein